MDARTEYIAKIRSIIPKMLALQHDDKATMEYHQLADAVYWPDEIPLRLKREEEDFLRALLHYRTSVMMREPDVEYQRYWELGKELFPKWIGFLDRRVELTAEEVQQILNKRERLDKELGLH